MRLQLQVAEIRLFWRETKLSYFEVLRHPGGLWSNAATPSLLKESEVSQASDGCLQNISLWMFSGHVKPYGRPITCCRDYMSHLTLECPRISQVEVESIAGESEVPCLNLLDNVVFK